MNPKAAGCYSVDGSGQAQNRLHWQAVLKNLWVG